MLNLKPKLVFFFITLLLLLNQHLYSQSDSKDIVKDSLRIMFYNVENLFDPFDDSLTSDEEFTETGERHWTWYKFQDKLSHVYKTILAAGNPFPPSIIGLCEIENRFVLNQLVYETALSKFDYRIVHEESPDRRGIDVALIFNPKKFELISHKAITVSFPFAPESTTRDILYVKGKVFGEDTIHVFVNHWPSRWGGQMATDPKRQYVAELLKKHTDSLFLTEDDPNIIIMGDFNDEPFDKSIKSHLQALDLSDSSNLVNLMLPLISNENAGTHKYQSNWGILDQFIVSKFLLLPQHSLHISPNKAHIFNASFLIEKDEKYLGFKPNRTFIGYKYHGGFSDHLPILLDIYKFL